MPKQKQFEFFARHNAPLPLWKEYDYKDRHIHYLEERSNSRELIIFFHGSPGSSRDFFKYMVDADLRDRFTMVAVDRPGFGYSNEGMGLNLNEQSRVMKPLLTHYSNQNLRVILAGHSLGGALVLRLAVDFPNMVNDLVLIAGSANAQLEPTSWYRPLLNSFPVRRMIPKWLKASNKELMVHKKDLQELENGLSVLRTRTTIIHGDKDSLVPVENAYFVKQKLIHTTVDLQILKNTNHFFLYNKPEILKDVLLRL